MIPYVSTSCLSNVYAYSKVLETYRDLNIRHIELGVFLGNFSEEPIPIDNKENTYIVHHYFPPPDRHFVVNLASPSEIILQKSIEQMKRSITFCSDHGIKLFSFHAGFRADPNEKMQFQTECIASYEQSFDTFTSAVQTLVDHAESLDVMLAIENNVIASSNLINGKNDLLLMCEAWEFEELFKRISSRYLGILLDLGHLKVSANILKFSPFEFIDSVESKVYALHIHDNNGFHDEHKCIFSQNQILSHIADLFEERATPAVLECNCHDVDELKRAFSTLKECCIGSIPD